MSIEFKQSHSNKAKSKPKTLPKSDYAISEYSKIIQRAQIEPDSLTHSDIMVLQRTIGNQAVNRLLECTQNKTGNKTKSKLIQRFVEPDNTPLDTEKANTGISENLSHGLEMLSGMDLSDVKVHRNSARPKRIGASAYTQGSDIYLGPGQEKHLPHEGWHVVQQKQGRVKATAQGKGFAINDDPRLEIEADRMGQRALQLKNSSMYSKEKTEKRGSLDSSFVQMKKPEKDTSKATAKIMKKKRESSKYWNYSSMTKNFAFNLKDDTVWANSQGNRHAEAGVLIESQAKYPGKDIAMVTERYPCEPCLGDIAQAEKYGAEVDVRYFVPYKKNPQDQENLYKHYNLWWDVPRKG